jgi:lipopolysaccharide/colanic/teichoic acid biosynthesis glycosyltransferase
MRIQKGTQIPSIPQYSIRILKLTIAERQIYYMAKRMIDIVIASCLLICLLPVFIIVGLAIFIYSPGPIFFVQERMGAKRQANGNKTYWEPTTFRCYKFRTMRVNADCAIHREYIKALIENNPEQMQAVQNAATRPRGHKDGEKLIADQNAPTRPRKLVDDARIIAPGKLLRKFSLDELPQLWNVLRGDMSMIGPRPAIPYEVKMYKPWHMKRLQVQPGITGLQQVTARCTKDFDEQVKLDLEYIDHQSLWLDLKIAIKTPLAVLIARGAH